MKYSIVGVSRYSKFCVIHSVCCDDNDIIGCGCSVRTSVVPIYVVNGFADVEIIGKTIVIKPFKKGEKWLDYIKFDERSK